MQQGELSRQSTGICLAHVNAAEGADSLGLAKHTAF